MGCLLPIIALIAPRTLLFFIFLLTNWFGRAYETAIWPILGFIFMPFTTLAYMAAMLNNNHHCSGGVQANTPRFVRPTDGPLAD